LKQIEFPKEAFKNDKIKHFAISEVF
jgi:hypothetical protein